MNTRMYYGRSVGDLAREQTIPGHANAEPHILMEGVSTVNLQQQHHNFMPHQMNFDPSTFSNVYYPFVAHLSGPSVSAIPLNYGSPDHLVSPYNNMTVFGGSSEEFGRSQFKESYRRSYQRKNAETSVGSSHCGPYESTSTSVNTPIDPRHLYYRHPPLYGGGSEFLSVSDSINDWSVRVRPGPAGINFIDRTHYNGYIQGSHDALSLQPVGPFPVDQMLAGNPALGIVGWNHPPAMPYMHGHMDHNFHQVPQMQGMSDHCFQFFPQVPTPHFPLTNGAISIPVTNPIGPRPRRSSRQITVGTNRPQVRAIPETMWIHCDIPYLTYVDDVAIVDLPEHYDVRHDSDDHSDMRMDIENMSYEEILLDHWSLMTLFNYVLLHLLLYQQMERTEVIVSLKKLIWLTLQELLALEEHIGNVNTGMSEESITNQLRTRQYELPSTYADAEETRSVDGETTSCIICLGDFENQEELGYLDCGHDYHADCLKKWLPIKNVCPVCKTQALPS